MLSLFGSVFLSVAMANDLDIGYDSVISKGMSPTLYITPSADIQEIKVGIDANGKHYDFVKSGEPAGQELAFSWRADSNATIVTAEIYAVFTDGYVAEAVMPMEFSYGAGLTVDYGSVSADRKKEELSVRVSQQVETAEIIAYGAEKKVLGQQTLSINSGPGEITLPWLGTARDTVLIDVTLRNADSFAGFTYSPWYLDIPHQDVLFESNAFAIDESEEWKLDSTLKELQDVLRKYGSVVPVKLYIAGCTDTVGDGSHNKKLSNQRAKAISDWLRGHGYDAPIYYYGFGESLQAVKTGDGVDESANRRVLYIVTSDTPPDLPSVSWKQLQ